MATKQKKKPSRLYTIYYCMKARCNNPNFTYYDIYGGRGISICEEWATFKAFEAWALSHGYADHLTLDRIDGDGGYCPENCRWATRAQQVRTRRCARLSEQKAAEIRERYAAGGVTMMKLAEEYDYDAGGICRIIHGQRWAPEPPR